MKFRIFILLFALSSASDTVYVQECGRPCQACVDQLGVPRDASGAPVFARSPVSKATFKECIGRVSQGGMRRTGGNTRSGR